MTATTDALLPFRVRALRAHLIEQHGPQASEKDEDAQYPATPVGDEIGALAVEDEQYLVLTYDEAHAAASEQAFASLWAADLSVLGQWDVWRLSTDEMERVLPSLEHTQNLLCENAQPLIAALVRDNVRDQIGKAMVDTDGIAHFLAPYDGREYPVKIDATWFHIYRVY